MATAGLTIWNDRIAPVFDVASQLIVVDELCDLPWQQLTLPEGSALEKLWFLKEHQVTTLICGAMTCGSYYAANGYGITVHRFIAGPCHAVIDGWRNHLPLEQHFPMPGCGGAGRQRRGRQRRMNLNAPPK
nr:hypothetical protein [uncultured Desulfuromonas sp.]